MVGGNANALEKQEMDDCKLFYQGTGFLEISQEDQRACQSLLQFLDVTQIPTIVVIPNRTGRPILGQEIALEWNGVDNDALLLQRWRDGSSGLTLSQNIVSKVLGDSSSVCTVM